VKRNILFFTSLQHDETDQESDKESIQNSSFGRMSFGRSILHEFDERSLFNKKVQRFNLNVIHIIKYTSDILMCFLILQLQRCIEPDPDSITSDISVLDEMDQYLDECLDEDIYPNIDPIHRKLNNDVKEEGPTPPKINKGDESPSMGCNNYKYSHSYTIFIKNMFLASSFIF